MYLWGIVLNPLMMTLASSQGEEQFMALMKAIDENGDQEISYEEFMAYLKKEEEDHNTKTMLPLIKDMPIEDAVKLIREKISLRVGGKKDGLQRAFKVIDADGSGTIEGSELREVLRIKASIDLDDQLLADGATSAASYSMKTIDQVLLPQ
jgi:Ca2+-binding EF-hand superfamily protein